MKVIKHGSYKHLATSVISCDASVKERERWRFKEGIPLVGVGNGNGEKGAGEDEQLASGVLRLKEGE